MNSVILGGKAFILRLCSSLVWDTLSNAPEMSRQSIEATIFGLVLQTVCTYSVMSLRAEVVDLPSLVPIWESKRSPLALAVDSI